MTQKVNRFKYDGFAVGGPWAGANMMRVGDPVWPVAKMKKISVNDPTIWDNKVDWEDTGRGRYEWDSGVWWWKGWE
jgi:hypothetical protein